MSVCSTLAQQPLFLLCVHRDCLLIHYSYRAECRYTSTSDGCWSTDALRACGLELVHSFAEYCLLFTKGGKDDDGNRTNSSLCLPPSSPLQSLGLRNLRALCNFIQCRGNFIMIFSFLHHPAMQALGKSALQLHNQNMQDIFFSHMFCSITAVNFILSFGEGKNQSQVLMLSVVLAKRFLSVS